jgi:UDP-GlcNAc3NAcA epimerase
MKILTIIGARPQFIKAAVVSRAIRESTDLEETIVHTGQHYDANMSEIFFEELAIPKCALNINVGSASHAVQTGRMLEGIEQAILAERPEMVMVYGDTNSTLAGSLAAAKLQVPVAHIEAGLRSYNRQMPEEINRVLTDYLSNLLFAPTNTAVENLRREGVSMDRVHLVGDVMYDAACYFGPKAEARSEVLAQLGVARKKYVLATLHRAENTDDIRRLRVILESLEQLSAELPVVLPLHPRTKKKIAENGLHPESSGNIRITDPVGYMDMLVLERNARLIATDSGGVQKEAFFHRVPCVIFRAQTEWTELIELGWSRLAPPEDTSVVAHQLREALHCTPDQEMSDSPYGDGHSAELITKILVEQMTTPLIQQESI